MTYRPRPYLPAVVGPRMAATMLREFGTQLELYVGGLERSPYADTRTLAEEWRRGLDSMRECARQLAERGPIAADGNSAMPSVAVGGSSVSSPPGAHLTVGQVAERTGLGRRRVRQLCELEDGPLSATKRGGVWLVDEVSVQAFTTARRPGT